jgi:gamma-glutamylcyclotransferase (GGCT)/AIG2-like uncharacterized protein YtfP
MRYDLMFDVNEYITATYGTLRLGHGNYRWAFGSNNIECIAQATTLSGYKMRTHGGFPAIYHTGDTTDKVVVDVFDLTTSTVEHPDTILEMVDGMEYGAGYSKRYVELDNGMMAYVYVYSKDRAECSMEHEVESGDWEVYCE